MLHLLGKKVCHVYRPSHLETIIPLNAECFNHHSIVKMDYAFTKRWKGTVLCFPVLELKMFLAEWCYDITLFNCMYSDISCLT